MQSTVLRYLPHLLLALVLQLGVLPDTAEAHLPPPAFFTIEVRDESTQVELVVLDGVVRTWFGFAPGDLPEDGALPNAQRVSIEKDLARWLHVAVNGLPTTVALDRASIETFQDHLRTWRYVKLEMRVTTDVVPKQLALAWTQFQQSDEYAFDEIEVELEAYGESGYPVLSTREPEFVWHRPRDVVEPPPVIVPTAIEQPTARVSWVALLILVGLLGWTLARGRRATGRRLLAVWAAGGLLALALMPVGVVALPVPWGGGTQRPDDDQALAIFASLHRGMYAALDGETEEAIYDTLADSVTGELLPTLYLDMHESLILHNEGGAVAKVKKTEILEAAVEPGGEPGAPWFSVRARWIVEGKVGHWGHTHQRINEYVATVTIVESDGRWKIAGLDVLEENRIDDGKQVGRPPR